MKGIRQNGVFSVNIPSADQVKETDYCGLVSGSMSDKAADYGFTVFFGSVDHTPLIEQCPVNHVCEVLHILNLGSHVMVIGKIVETHLSENCLTNGKIDIKKARPMVYTTAAQYMDTGEQVGSAFSTGKVVNPVKVEESRK